MLKLIPIILSLTLMGAGGAAMSFQNSHNITAKANLQSYMRTNQNLDFNSQNGSDLFLKAN